MPLAQLLIPRGTSGRPLAPTAAAGHRPSHSRPPPIRHLTTIKRKGDATATEVMCERNRPSDGEKKPELRPTKRTGRVFE